MGTGVDHIHVQSCLVSLVVGVVGYLGGSLARLG
jgi:hypothetical protein